MPNPLDPWRNEIDDIDAQLMRLFEQRMALARRIGEYKAEHCLPIQDVTREAAVLEKRAAQVRDPALAEPTKAFFTELMRLSRGLQQQAAPEDPPLSAAETPRVAYQGVPGAYGHQALLQHFYRETEELPSERFEDVFIAVKRGDADYGVVPLENSSSGSIAEVYDLLGRYRLWIVGEELVHVRHCLLGVPGARMDDIRAVYSHEQGFLQCAAFLEKHPDWQRVPCFNTAIAAARIAQEGDKRHAAIASRLAAEAYGLSVLAKDIHTFSSNFTRFIVIGRECAPSGNKAALTFTLRHERGALHRALACYVALGLNLVRIESRPIPDSPWKYRFFVDVEGTLNQQRLAVLLEVLREECASAELLGVFTPASQDSHEE